MLKGDAKTAYQREYMRKKRAGLPTATKPKAEWRPTQAMVDQIQHWRQMRVDEPWRLRDTALRVLDGLTNKTWTEDDMMEACRRLKAHQDEREAERERREDELSKPVVWHCLFCGEPESPERLLYGKGISICEKCIDEAAAAMARHRKKP